MSDLLELEKDLSETLNDTATVQKVNPDLLKLMVALTESMLEDSDHALKDVAYQTVKSVLRNPSVRPKVSSVIPAIFVYYLQVHQTVSMTLDTSLGHGDATNQAALSLFDNYIEFPDDHTARILTEYAAKAIHEVIVSKLSQDKNLVLQDLLGRLSTLALFTETTKDYMSRVKRKQNIPYISWLKGFLQRCLDSNDLEFLESDETVKLVNQQIMNRVKLVKI